MSLSFSEDLSSQIALSNYHFNQLLSFSKEQHNSGGFFLGVQCLLYLFETWYSNKNRINFYFNEVLSDTWYLYRKLKWYKREKKCKELLFNTRIFLKFELQLLSHWRHYWYVRNFWQYLNLICVYLYVLSCRL